MTFKGQIMTQIHYEKEQRYLKVLQESFWRGEISRDEAIKALRSMGFSNGIAAIKLKEWSSNTPKLDSESKRVLNKRQKEMTSLENYFKKKWVPKKKKKNDLRD